jgi:hypothetical protein
MDDYTRNAERNADEIESEVDSLEVGHWHMLELNYKEFWDHAKEVSGLFRTLKPLRRDDRERLWNKFDSICKKVKEKQQAEHDDLVFKSTKHCDEIIHEAESARPCDVFGLFTLTVDDMKSYGDNLRKAADMLSNFKHEMLRDHKQECFERIKEIREVHDSWWKDRKRNRN